jgi:hypothetical protein
MRTSFDTHPLSHPPADCEMAGTQVTCKRVRPYLRTGDLS